MKGNLIKIIGFLLPFELPFSYVMHVVLKPGLGEFYRIGFNGIWGAIVMMILLSYTRMQRTNYGYIKIALLFIVAGFWEYIVTLILDAMAIEAITQFVCGFFFPAALTLVLINSSEEDRNSFFKAWYLGTIALIIVAFFTTFYYYGNLPDWFKDKDIAFKLISFRYAYEGDSTSNGMMLILGNFNKASNYLLMMLLFSVRLLGNNGDNRKFLSYFWLLATITLLVLFSRLALLLFPFVYYASGIRQYGKRIIKIKYFAILLGLFLGYYIWKYSDFIKPTLDYLLYSKFDENSEDLGVLGTGNNRLQAWALLIDKLKDIGIWLHGLGVGRFGIEYGGSKDLGTHNLIFDHFFASGFLVPCIVMYICITSFLKGILRKDRIVIIGVPVILALFFREYSFSYLFVTSQGGLVFMVLAYIAYYKNGEKEVVDDEGASIKSIIGQI